MEYERGGQGRTDETDGTRLNFSCTQIYEMMDVRELSVLQGCVTVMKTSQEETQQICDVCSHG